MTSANMCQKKTGERKLNLDYKTSLEVMFFVCPNARHWHHMFGFAELLECIYRLLFRVGGFHRGHLLEVMLRGRMGVLGPSHLGIVRQLLRGHMVVGLQLVLGGGLGEADVGSGTGKLRGRAAGRPLCLNIEGGN